MRRALVGTLISVVTVAAVVAVGWIGLMWWESRLPGTYNVMDYGEVDLGGGAGSEHEHQPGPKAELRRGQCEQPGPQPEAA